jgi:hypothetical protein
MTDNPVTEYLIRPQDIRAEITLKRYKDKDYLVWFGSVFLVLFFLSLILHTVFWLFWLALFISFIGTGFFFLMIIVSGDSCHPFWDMEKILITTTGLALRDYQGKVRYMMPFAKVTGIRYGFSENLASAMLDLRVRVPLSVMFDLNDGKTFTIPMNYIVEEEQQKVFAYLTGVQLG